MFLAQTDHLPHPATCDVRPVEAVHFSPHMTLGSRLTSSCMLACPAYITPGLGTTLISQKKDSTSSGIDRNRNRNHGRHSLARMVFRNQMGTGSALPHVTYHMGNRMCIYSEGREC